MNYSTAIFLISDEIRAVEATYEAADDARRTVFKTFDDNIQVDDYVVVPTDTRHKMTVCKIVEVDVDIDFDTKAEIGWIVGVVDRADFEKISTQEAEAIAKIKTAEKRRKRDKLRASLIADHDAEVKALPLYSLEDKGKGDAATRKD